MPKLTDSLGTDQNVNRRSVLKALVGGAAAGFVIPEMAKAQAYALRVEHKTLALERWDANGFRLAFLSDFHLNSEAALNRAMSAIRMAQQEKPDIILLGGDFLERATQPHIDRMERFCRKLTNRSIPIATVLGNHDYWSLASRKIMSFLQRAGVKVLQNDRFEFQGVTIAGVDDGIDGRQRFDFYDEGKVSQSLVSILHEPDFVQEQPAHVSLQLSGHSHGGQVCLPGGGHLFAPKYGRKYVSGFYGDLPVPLYVSRGVGTTGPDLRAFCAPEVSILTINHS